MTLRSEAADPIVVNELPEFPPTLREVMLRGRWIGVLLACLAVAGIFAWLGQWQLARAVQFDPPPPGITEDLRPIGEVIEPGEYLPEVFVGQRVSVSGTWVPEDFLIVTSRFNGGEEGFWITGQLRTEADAPTSLAVAIGWTAQREQADAAVLDLAAAAEAGETVQLQGRIISDEGPGAPPRSDPRAMTRMSPAALLSQWHDIEQLNVYRPYLVADNPDGGLTATDLEAILAQAPEELSPINWLNLFYAAEWVVFAGFAFYLWYRLARDAWEREVEAHEDARAQPTPAAG